MSAETRVNFYTEWCDADYKDPDNCLTELTKAMKRDDIEEVGTCIDWIVADVLDSVRLAMDNGEGFEDAVATAGEYYGNTYT